MIAEYNVRKKTIKIRTSFVHDLMNLLKLTADDLAEYAGVSVGIIDRILCDGECSPIVIGKLANALGCSVWELLA